MWFLNNPGKSFQEIVYQSFISELNNIPLEDGMMWKDVEMSQCGGK